MSWDYIIVGAGSAGCALAYQLARARPDKTILLVEAGGPDRSPLIKIPATQPQASAKYDWGYRSQPDPTRNGATEKWKRGRVLGGSSSINGMVYVRGAASDFDRWSALCEHRGGWSAQEIMPLFREMESSDQGSALRGHRGPLRVTTVKRPHPITDAFIQAAGTAGYAFNEDYNGSAQDGVAYLQRTVWKGLRCSSADAFLKPLHARANLRVLPNATAEKIEMVAGRATAVRIAHQGTQRRETTADVILCAGAINSPKLLMLSGIGDPEELRRHHIDVVLERNAVGQNLKEHPLVRLVYRSKIPTYNLTEGILQKLAIAARFFRYREGPIAGVYESAAFLRSNAERATPDLQAFFAPMGYMGKMGGAGGLTPYPAFMICVVNSYPCSTGQVRLVSADAQAAPLIECRLLQAPEDVDTLVRGIEAIRRIVKCSPMAEIVDSEIEPGSDVDTAEALRAFTRSNAQVTFHPIGTCRMGVDAEAVVGPDLRVRGTENLWIADASIMPDHISANINAACIMIGLKLGKQLAAAT